MSATAGQMKQGNADNLARVCLEQLERERSHLETIKQLLDQTHATLLSADPGGLAVVMQQQQQAAEATAKMRQDRASFRQEIARAWAVLPATVTLPWLANVLGEEMGQRLLQERQALQHLSAEVRKVLESNAALMFFCLDFLQRFFADLSGSQPSGCYGPVGALQEAPCGSIIEARG